MLIVGAKGFAKELLQVVLETTKRDSIVFYDDVSEDLPEKLFGQYRVIRSLEEVQQYFEHEDPRFCLGLGNPQLRETLKLRMEKCGGLVQSVVSQGAFIGDHDVILGAGTCILPGAKLSNSVSLGMCGLVYYNAVLTHDVQVGDFVEISPGATLLGHSNVGNFTQIGANATLLPGVEVGSHCIVGAGAVVTKNILNGSVVAGVPAKVLRTIP